MLQKIKNGKHSSLDNLTFGVTFAKKFVQQEMLIPEIGSRNRPAHEKNLKIL